MDFALTQEQRQIRDTVAAFVDAEVVPRAAEIDGTDEFPRDLIDEMADLGLMGMPIPEEYGGAGLDYHAYPEALVEAGAAVLLGDGHAHQSEVGHLVDEVPRELVSLVDLGRAGDHLRVDERRDQIGRAHV